MEILALKTSAVKVVGASPTQSQIHLEKVLRGQCCLSEVGSSDLTKVNGDVCAYPVSVS